MYNFGSHSSPKMHLYLILHSAAIDALKSKHPVRRRRRNVWIQVKSIPSTPLWQPTMNPWSIDQLINHHKRNCSHRCTPLQLLAETRLPHPTSQPMQIQHLQDRPEAISTRRCQMWLKRKMRNGNLKSFLHHASKDLMCHRTTFICHLVHCLRIPTGPWYYHQHRRDQQQVYCSSSLDFISTCWNYV